MLPSTGLFRGINCPYYENVEIGCKRNFCHFKHANKKGTKLVQKEILILFLFLHNF